MVGFVIGYYGLGFYFDPTYWLVIIGTVICLFASAYVDSVMGRFHKQGNMNGISGVDCARRILDNEGLYYVNVECVDRGDHYDPKEHTVRLSRKNFYGTSVTAVSVAAHECGHAIQHGEEYRPLQFRSGLVPVVNICSYAGIPLIMIGILFSYNQFFIQLGIWTFVVSVVFQFVTLPVEFNASRRATKKLEAMNILNEEELSGSRKVLRAAAYTYVAAVAAAVLQLMRLVLLFGGNRRRD